MNSRRVTVREATLDLLRTFGATTVFGNPGSTELSFLNEWPADFRYIMGLQEASVVGMADGYARVTKRPSLCNLHSAAGVGNGLGNVYTAARNQTPLVILAGQQSRSLLPLNPFLGASDASSFPRPYVKWSCEPARAEDVPAAIAHAFHIAMQRPWGPVFVSVPFDDWQAATHPVPARMISADVSPDPKALDAAARALCAARKPVFVIGAEIDQDDAGPAMVELAERIGAAVWAAPFASRVVFPEDHPQFAGFLPAAPEAVSDALSSYDLVFVIGAPVFTFHVAGTCALFNSGVSLFQFSADGEALAAAPIGTGILGNLRLALPALVERVPSNHPRLHALEGRAPPPRPKADIPIKAEFLLDALSRAMPADAIIIEEAPVHRAALQAYLPIKRWSAFHTMASGGLGYALPASVGVALGAPQQRTICIIGDGSMMYSVQALWTAVQHALPLTVIVLNNGGYGALRSFSEVLQVRHAPSFDLPGLDFVALARGMGCEARTLDKPHDVADALAQALSHDGPFLLDVIVDRAVPILYPRLLR